MDSATGPFCRSERLLDSRDFARVSREGRRYAGRAFVMLLARRRQDTDSASSGLPRRIGISASRRVGNAVTRNRLKRGIREWFRKRRERLPRGVDVVVIARRAAAELDGQGIGDSLDDLVARATKRAAQRK